MIEDYRTHEVATYWVSKLEEAVDVLRLIAFHPIDTKLSAAAMRQLARNYIKSKGYMKPGEALDVNHQDTK